MTANLLRVLVIEDDPAIRRLQRASLSRRNYRVIEAPTAAAGLAALAKEEPELCVLDLGLPDRDGLDLVAGIRRGHRVPIATESGVDYRLVTAA